MVKKQKIMKNEKHTSRSEIGRETLKNVKNEKYTL